MRNKSKIKVIILTIVIFIAVLGITNCSIYNDQDGTLENQDEKKLKSLKKSAGYSESFIHIDGSIPGNWTGTTGYPWCYIDNGVYIIENVTIDASGSPIGSGILIENSKNVYFIIRNCTVYNASIGSYPDYNAGIKLYNTNNGTLIDNNCSNNSCCGIFLSYNCDNNTISDNTADEDFVWGILLSEDCDNNTISGNKIDNNRYGISLANSRNIVMSENIMNKCGLIMSGSFEQLSSYNIDITNLVNGKPLYYYSNELNLGSDNFTDAGQVILVNCNNSLISNLNFSYCSTGISLNYCNNNTISGNTANNNINAGIELYFDCDNNIISGNTVNDNSGGIDLIFNCDNNTISGNTANDNSGGIELYDNCNFNSILGNTLYNNHYGIYSWDGDNNTLSGNTANYNDYGIFLTDYSDNNTVSGNNLDSNLDGIFLHDHSINNIISKNTANNNRYGISLGNNCDNNTISGNTANNNADYGISLYDNCDNNTISGNTANNNTKRGISLYNRCDWNNIINNTLCQNDHGMHLDSDFIFFSCQYNNIKENKIFRNDLGIMLRWSNNNNISENSLIDNGWCIYEFECIGNIIENNNCSGFTLQSPIFINGTATGVDAHNWTWAAKQAWCSGSGTWNDPYIIESQNIDGFGITNCIEIKNSEKFFKIINCTLYNSAGAIDLSNVNNSHLIDNNCSNNQYGIVLGDNCDNNTISENILNNNNQDGINLDSLCDSNTIIRNTIYYNENYGVYLTQDCNNNNFTGNFIYFNTNGAIDINSADCDQNIIRRNVLVSEDERFIDDDGTNSIISMNYELATPPLLYVEVINQSFLSTAFIINIHVSSEVCKDLWIQSIQIWWNGIIVPSNNITDLGEGEYKISVTPIFVALGEDSILLNMTISEIHHLDKYFETYIAIEPPEIPEPCVIVKFLYVEITEHSYLLEQFNLTFFIFNETGQGIDFATINMWWNENDISDDVQNLGKGLYFVSLEPITVMPGEDPILLKMVISASGYEDKAFKTYLAIDPDTLEKEVGKAADGVPLVIILVAIISTAAGITVATATVVLLRKRKRASEVV